MKISVLNGYNRVNPTYPVMQNGYSRVLVNYAPMNGPGYMLNGVQTEMDLFLKMPAHIQQEYLIERALGNPVTINGLKDWLNQRKADKSSKRADKREYKDSKRAIHLAKMEAGTDLGSKLGSIAVQAAESLSGKALSMLPGDEAAIYDAMTETSPSGAADGEYTEKGLRKNWWQKLETWQQATIVGVGVLGLDFMAKGPISKGLGYARKGGKK